MLRTALIEFERCSLFWISFLILWYLKIPTPLTELQPLQFQLEVETKIGAPSVDMLLDKKYYLSILKLLSRDKFHPVISNI
jgi:hypothetical protein